MRYFIAIAVISLGIGLYAAAALLWDRRLQVAQYLARATATGQVRLDAPTIAAKRQTVYWSIVGCLVVGTIFILGSCVGVAVL